MDRYVRTNSTLDCIAYCGGMKYPYVSRNGTDSQTGQITCGCGSEISSGYQLPESSCSAKCDGTAGV